MLFAELLSDDDDDDGFASSQAVRALDRLTNAKMKQTASQIVKKKTNNHNKNLFNLIIPNFAIAPEAIVYKETTAVAT